MNKLPGFGLIERARALAPLIASEADEIERTRRLTPPVVSGLIENGLYRSLLPQSVGGAEAPPETKPSGSFSSSHTSVDAPRSERLRVANQPCPSLFSIARSRPSFLVIPDAVGTSLPSTFWH